MLSPGALLPSFEASAARPPLLREHRLLWEAFAAAEAQPTATEQSGVAHLRPACRRVNTSARLVTYDYVNDAGLSGRA